MMRFRLASLAAGLAATLVAGAAQADTIAPGDTITYDITTPDGILRRPVVSWISAAEQIDDTGALVIRNSFGARVENKGWRYLPHDGEFPEDGPLTPGKRWSTQIETWQQTDPSRVFSHIRTCEVTRRDTFAIAGKVFPGALLVSCVWTSLTGETYRSSETWYWRDGGGRYILISSDQRSGGGTLSVRLNSFSNPDLP